MLRRVYTPRGEVCARTWVRACARVCACVRMRAYV